MKNSIIISLIFMFLVPGVVSARIRCGNNIISKGDSSAKVMMGIRKCGEIIEKEVIQENIKGTIRRNGDFNATSELTERWYMVVNQSGGDYCWTLIFKGGRLFEFENWDRCD